MSGQSDQVKGHLKETAGIVTGDEDLQAEGKAERQVGEAKEKLDEAKHKVEELMDSSKDKLDEATDKVKDALPHS